MKKIKIGYRDYKIKEKNNLIVDGEECYGMIETDKEIITLNKRLDKKLKTETLIHEVVHGISEMYEADLTEDQVNRISKGLYIVLRDNKLIP